MICLCPDACATAGSYPEIGEENTPEETMQKG